MLEIIFREQLMNKEMEHIFYYVLAYYSEQGELTWNVCSDVTTDYDSAFQEYERVKATGKPCKLRAKTVRWETLEEDNV